MIWNSSTDQATADYFNGPGRSAADGSALLEYGSQLEVWNLVGMADFNGDGVLHLVWQYAPTGQVNVNYYNSANQIIGYAVLRTNPGAGWSVVAAADVDGQRHAGPDLAKRRHWPSERKLLHLRQQQPVGSDLNRATPC